jgi:hypothetical protein
MQELRSIDVVSGVNDDGDGFVTVTATDQNRGMMVGQLPPDTLRELAMNFLACAEASETDAIVYRLLRDKFGLDMEIVGLFVSDMRNMREG